MQKDRKRDNTEEIEKGNCQKRKKKRSKAYLGQNDRPRRFERARERRSERRKVTDGRKEQT